MILEEAPPLAETGPARPRHLLTLSTRSAPSLEDASRALVEHLACDRALLEDAMEDMRVELAGRLLMPARPDVSASWMAELRRRLEAPSPSPSAPAHRPRDTSLR